MNLERAIEVLSWENTKNNRELAQEQRDAIQLGIEALQVLNDMRNNPDFDYTIPLPGETKE